MNKPFLREHFFDGYKRVSLRSTPASHFRSAIWLSLEKFPLGLRILGSFWRLLRLPEAKNVFDDIYQKRHNKLKSPLYSGKNNYFEFTNLPYQMITIGEETRPSLTTSNGISLKGKAILEDNSRIRLGVSLNENIPYDLLDAECRINVCLTDKGETVKNSFAFPVNGSNGLFFYKPGESWIDWYMDIPFPRPCSPELFLKAEFFKGGKSTNHKNSTITWSAPQVLKKSNKDTARKIIYISIESLSDIGLLRDKLGLEFDIPNYADLEKNSTSYTCAYTQGDSTLPIAGTLFTGLLPLQHGVVNYKVKPWDKRVVNLSPNIKTIAEILKSKGFYTQAYLFQPRFSPRYGWYRGFDSYRFSSYIQNTPAFPSRFAINFLDESRDHNAFLFMHWDGLHHDYWMSEPLSKLVLQKGYGQDKPMSKNSLYSERLRYLDTELGILVNFLKSSGLWDQSLIIVTGDHGYGSDNWKNHGDFALYEERIRVPLLIKMPKGHKAMPKKVTTPTNAILTAIKAMYDASDISLPQYSRNLPQWNGLLKDFAISETVMQPKHDDYACALISSQFKYFFRCKIDWNNFLLKNFLYHKLFILSDDWFDEAKDVSGSYKSETEKFRKLALQIVKSNLDFLSKHKPINLTDII
ncbi:sulfatase-like hydrolase/transferase [Candidatus Omnitrophota bacterium]